MLQENLEYEIWDRKDKIIISWIYNSITLNKLTLLYGNSSSYRYWTTLAINLHDNSSSNIMELRWRLRSMRKDNQLMDMYIKKVKELFNLMSAIVDQISLCEQVFYLMGGLNSTNYLSLVTSVMNKKKMSSLDEIFSMMRAHKKQIMRMNTCKSCSK